jgi:succinate dehydrogenase flavin-adding protein (antitoxin of CptAB toxin-antitoxin module)
MKSIKEILEEFLSEQQARLSPKTYSGYEEAIYYFRIYLNNFGHQHLNKTETKRYEKLEASEDRKFWEIFGPEHLSSSEISDFLADFMVRKVAGSKTLMEITGRVIFKLVKWLHKKGYIPDKEYEEMVKAVEDLKVDLPLVGEVTDLIYDYVDKHPVENNYTSDLDAYFEIVKIEPGKIWLKDYLESGKEVGPVIVSEEISSKSKIGWTVSLWIVKTGKVWRILESGNMYP